MFSWVFPVVTGAVIGYVTNAVAIKMLFRPLKEVRMFGVRLPFTPGVLPRRRHELSRSIGDMVARDLLSEDVFVWRIISPEAEKGAASAVSGFIVKICGSEKSEALESFAAAVRTSGLTEQMTEAGWTFLSAKIPGFLRRPEIKAYLVQQGNGLIDDIFDSLTSVQRLLLAAGNYRSQIQSHMESIVDSFIERSGELLSSEDIQKRVVRTVTSAADTETVRGFLRYMLESAAGGETLKEQADTAAAFIAPKLISAAARSVPAVLDKLDIRKIVIDKIDSLEMLQVERMVFGIMKSQFRWINFFGAVLGALIGLSQVLMPFVSVFAQRIFDRLF